jgi:hypothetical protein
MQLSFGQISSPSWLLLAYAVFGVSFLSLVNTQKQHRNVDNILFASAIIGVASALFASDAVTVLPYWLCRTVPASLLSGQAASLLIGVFTKESASTEMALLGESSDTVGQEKAAPGL